MPRGPPVAGLEREVLRRVAKVGLEPTRFYPLDFESSASAIPPLGRSVTRIEVTARQSKGGACLSGDRGGRRRKSSSSEWLFPGPVGRMGDCPVSLSLRSPRRSTGPGEAYARPIHTTIA